jgi:mono/diheme cytochrome c family protein
MKFFETITLGLALSISALAAASSMPPTQSDSQSPSSKLSRSSHPAMPDRGQRVFQQNCARCHAAPQGFSPSASGAVARHMRVRANLSDADFRALLHFLNP